MQREPMTVQSAKALNDELIELAQSPVLRLDTVATYDVRLEIESHQGCFAEITKTLEVKEVTGLADLERMGIVFYPNPSKGILQFNIQQELMNDLHLKVMTLTGQQLLELPINESHVEIDLSRLESGIYLVNFSNHEIN